MTELWFVDITKYVYDTLKNYVPLLEQWVEKVIIRKFESVAKEARPFITFSSMWWPVSNSLWIRSETFEFEIYTESFEQWSKIKDILVDLFNRRNFKGIRSKLLRTWPSWSDEKTGYSRHMVDIDFVFKDMKY